MFALFFFIACLGVILYGIHLIKDSPWYECELVGGMLIFLTTILGLILGGINIPATSSCVYEPNYKAVYTQKGVEIYTPDGDSLLLDKYADVTAFNPKTDKIVHSVSRNIYGYRWYSIGIEHGDGNGKTTVEVKN